MATEASPTPREDEARAVLASTVRAEHARILAALVATLRDLDRAEDALQDAMSKALERWPTGGTPRHPAAWLIVTARRRAIDQIRHDTMRRQKEQAIRGEELRRLEERAQRLEAEGDTYEIPDERLRLLYLCCHPALSEEAQVALTLRSFGGLSTAGVARAFLVTEKTMAKRLERAKQKIRRAAIPFALPAEPRQQERLEAVLATLYLIFNHGYTASAGDPRERSELRRESVQLLRILQSLVPRETEVSGLLALTSFHEARQPARWSRQGEMIPLDEQRAELFTVEDVRAGWQALVQARASPGRGAYQIQAEIAALHIQASVEDLSEAERFAQVVPLYVELDRRLPTPIVRLNRATAMGLAGEPHQALERLESLADWCEEHDYQPYFAAKAELLSRSGQLKEAIATYDRAVELTDSAPERRFLKRRRSQIAAAGCG